MAVEFKKVRQKALAKVIDMPAEQASETIEIITAAIDKFLTSENFEKAAMTIKENMDKKFGPTWHVCIGEGFGFEITYEAKQLAYMQYQEKLGILCFKC